MKILIKILVQCELFRTGANNIGTELNLTTQKKSQEISPKQKQREKYRFVHTLRHTTAINKIISHRNIF